MKTFMMAITRRYLVVFTSIILTTCSSGGNNNGTQGSSSAKLASITVTGAQPSVMVGSTDQFSAIAKDTSGNTMSGVAFSWTSSATGVATIAGTTGLATAAAVGTTQIVASSGGVSSAPVTLTVIPIPLAVKGVSNNSPMALTPLYVTTTGLDITQPATIVLSNTSGYSATLTPMRIEGDGTVVIAVPLYIDPTTGNTGGVNVNLTITQGSQTSAPIPFSIQDIPQLSAYGTTLGQISHSFFVFQSLQLAERANEVQSIQLAANTAIDVAPLLNSLAARAKATVLALKEIDLVMNNNSVVIPAGTLPDGSVAQFDQTSLATMDRVLGIYLTEVFSPVNIKASAALGSKVMQWRQQFLAHSSKSVAWANSLPPATLTTVANVPQFVTAIQNAQVSCGMSGSVRGCVTDLTAATGIGISQAAAVLKEVVSGKPYLSRAVGALGAVVGAAATTGQVFGDLFAFEEGLRKNDPATMNSAIAAMKSLDTLELYNTTLALLAAPEFAAIATANAALASGSAVVGFVNFIYMDAKAGVDKSDRDATLSLAVAAAQKASQQPQQPLVGSVGGTVQPSTTPPGSLPTVTGIGLQPFGSPGAAVGALADPSGAYQMYVPLGVSNTTYSGLIVSAFDPTTRAQIGSNAVDLSGLTSTTPQILAPIIQGVSVQPACTPAQVIAWNQACLNTYNAQVAICDTLPTLIQQLQCVNAALAAYEACYGSCVP